MARTRIRLMGRQRAPPGDAAPEPSQISYRPRRQHRHGSTPASAIMKELPPLE